MTTLVLFWISTCVGAALFFAAGVVMTRRSRRASAWTGQTTQAKTHVANEQLLTEPLVSEQRLAEQRLTEQLATEQLATEQLAALSLRAHAAERERDSALQALEQDRQTERVGAADVRRARDQVRAIEGERNELRGQLGTMALGLQEAETTTKDSVASLAAQKARLAELQSELNVTQKRLAASQASHEDYIRLRTERDENTFLRSEIARLKAEVVDARAGGSMIPKAPARRARPTGAELSKLPLSEALDQAVHALIGDRVGSVVLADEVGFPVTHTDEHGAALAAFSSLVISAGDRAHSFAPVGKTQSISIVDEGGAQISIWPFDQDGSRLSLVTLSRSPLEPGQVATTMLQVTALLNRPRPGAGDSMQRAKAL